MKIWHFFTGDAYGGGECCQNFWQYRYKGILRCNIAIERIPGVEFEDESLRDRYVAEAKFLRAYQYFDLVRYFWWCTIGTGDEDAFRDRGDSACFHSRGVHTD